MSSTIYLLAEGSYSDYKVLAAFTTREKAEAIRKLSDYSTEHGGPFNDLNEVEEVPLDPDAISSAPPGYCWWRARRYDDGQILACACPTWKRMESDPPDLYEPSPFEYSFATPTRRHGLRVYVCARDQDHAVKVASELFTQYDARQAGIA